MQRDDVDLAQPARTRSVTTLVAPIGLVAALVANTAYVATKLGVREEKLDTVVASVGEIKAEMYRHTDAEKDREVVNLKIDNLTRRVEVLEAARARQVQIVQARQEKQEDDLLSRAWRSISGGK
jgi:hypothetical protein